MSDRASGRPTLAACLIVKDGARTLERCVASVRPHVDEVCVFDTGSTDGTFELLDRLAGEPGAPIRVERGEWRDDFAEARNRSFALASSEHVAWFDDDEVLEGGAELRGLLERSRPDALYVGRAVVAGSSVACMPVLRVVRAAVGARWSGPVHELLGPIGPEREVADPRHVRVVHHAVEEAGRHRHRALVERHVREWPHLSYYLGYHLWRDGDSRRALAAFEAAVDFFADRRASMNLAVAYRMVAVCRRAIGDEAGAVEALRGFVDASAAIRRDGFLSRVADLEAAAPISDDDPLWRYADDPRTAPHERERVSA